MRVMALFSTSFFAKCLRVGEDGPGRGHLCHTDTFLVITLVVFIRQGTCSQKEANVALSVQVWSFGTWSILKFFHYKKFYDLIHLHTHFGKITCQVKTVSSP